MALAKRNLFSDKHDKIQSRDLTRFENTIPTAADALQARVIVFARRNFDRLMIWFRSIDIGPAVFIVSDG